ncbi:multidrug efflux MFS transporter [Frankia sp. CNm7]|uniref:Multidrug efflux MFS transporter n=1 Tax=Frankia nepalensis TaxID=1836974 RepID=A0A937RIY1_9ACTN|nr:MDR family MFS transporter [Frankia nepalensis]MBL7500806.1 multidrug efflux MFS transporter [Frankia nepalensis]MBL7512613.1 multidrug efflux MFS transporter [Frankia nepalensis]MBL7523053.1 multidrug efflux MFS transporter [Frankia nepalensis]MBL7628194.1 multidrug efflux MFS transporter [Frankia nepalensis]
MTVSPRVDDAAPRDDGIELPDAPAPAKAGAATRPVTAGAARGRTPLVIKLLVAATFVVILNETIMINAVPRLMDEFAISPRTAQWLSTVFMLTMAAVIPITGWFLQRVTTRTAYGVAMATFCTGTVIGAVAPAFPILLTGRVVQAAGTAVMMPLLMTTLMTVVPESDRGRVMGNVTMAMSCAPALGPAVSGVILQLGSWRLIFVFMLPVALLVAVAGLRQLENVGETTNDSLNWPSVVLAALGFSGLLFGLSEIGARDGIMVGLIIAGGAGLVAAFAALQMRLARLSSPLLDLRALVHRSFRVSLLLMAAAHMAFFGAMFLLPLYLQDVRDLSELQTGLLVMPGGLAMGVLGPAVGRLYDQFGARPLVIPGSAATVASLGVLAWIGRDTPYSLLLAAHIVLMAALAAVLTPVFSVGLGDLPAHLYSHGSSLLGTIMQVAGAIGTALLVVILEARSTRLTDAGSAEADALVGGMRWAFAAAALIAVVLTLLALRLPNRPKDADAEAGSEPAPAV